MFSSKLCTDLKVTVNELNHKLQTMFKHRVRKSMEMIAVPNIRRVS